ncbi:MAG: CvpA family protein [Alistipes sp.]|nr:CvpA family protein [Alistipes sp.]
MVIDIVLLIVICVALLYGWRKGAIVQFLQLAGVYLAILLAPDYADEVGAIFTEDAGLAYLIGYGVIIIGAWIALWIVAPLFRKMLFFDALRRIDSMLGMVLSFVATIIIVSVLFSLFVTANIGDMRSDKILELGTSGLTAAEIDEYAEMLESRDESLRDYFEPKYIDYKTLDESKFFNPLAEFGKDIFPGLEEAQREIMEWTLNMAAKYDGE